MIDPIAVGQTVNYVSKQEITIVEEKEVVNPNATIWIIGAIDSIQKAQIQATWVEIEEGADGEKKLSRNKSTFVTTDFDIVRYGLKGFKNFGNAQFVTEKRKLFDREVEVVSDDTLKLIPIEIIRELSDAIWTGNQVSRDLEKN
jgi:hypothetical protein